MDKFFGLILLAVVLEGIVTYFTTFVIDRKFQWQMVATMCFGIFIAVAYQVDLIGLFGLHSKIPFVGMVLTGILLSRGSNYVFDLIKRLQGQGEKKGSAADDAEINPTDKQL